MRDVLKQHNKTLQKIQKEKLIPMYLILIVFFMENMIVFYYSLLTFLTFYKTLSI